MTIIGRRYQAKRSSNVRRIDGVTYGPESWHDDGGAWEKKKKIWKLITTLNELRRYTRGWCTLLSHDVIPRTVVRDRVAGQHKRASGRHTEETSWNVAREHHTNDDDDDKSPVSKNDENRTPGPRNTSQFAENVNRARRDPRDGDNTEHW